MKIGIRVATVALGVSLGACGSGGGPATTEPGGTPNPGGGPYPGFDIAVYPGDAAMRAWLRPASPYFWSGYYLMAPCHRDPTWTGKFGTLSSMGWGVTAIYVGQQDWTQIPIAPMNRAVDPESSPNALRVASALAVCSASLLTIEQGLAEATDAATKMSADGFPAQSVVFLDVEYVSQVTPALLDYYRAWIRGVLADGRYLPGVYAAKSNATSLYGASVEAFRAAGRTDAPPFWIASGTGFSMSSPPTAVGFDFARLWQGMFNVSQSWADVPLTIDVNVASARSPSAPATATARATAQRISASARSAP